MWTSARLTVPLPRRQGELCPPSMQAPSRLGAVMRGKVLVGVAGAPTVVLDASLWACCDGITKHYSTLVCNGGPAGLLSGNWTSFSSSKLSPEPRGGTALGAGRHSMIDDDLTTLVQRLASHRIDALVLAGGNGTMDLLSAISREAERQSYEIQTIGIPKTIDNDLLGVDFSPGFPSAANYVSTTMTALAHDHEAMSSIESIRVVETMGRGTGWLAAAGASVVQANHPNVAPAACLIPERNTNPDELLDLVDVSLTSRDKAFIVCSEGFSFGDVSTMYQARNHQRLLLGGVSRRLARFLEEQFGLPARGEVLGTQQRCAHTFVSGPDLTAAHRIGAEAARYLLDGLTGVMVGSVRLMPETPSLDLHPVPLAEVAGRTRQLPPHYWPNQEDGISRYASWLGPLLTSHP